LSPVVDVHLEMSRLFFGDTDHREQAKTITHGLNYGRGVASIAEQVRRPPADVEAMIDRYRQQYPEVAGWQAQQRTWAERGQLLASGTGRHIGSDPDRAHTTAPARVAQACARDLALTGLLAVTERAATGSGPRWSDLYRKPTR